MSPHDLTYAAMLRHILDNGEPHKDRTGVGTTSVFGYQNRYDVSEHFPLLTTKRMAWKSIVTELRWFLLGRTDNQWLVDRKCTIWNEWATAEQCAKFGRAEGEMGPVYGRQWRDFGSRGADQIRALSNDLETNPGSRRLIVTAWHPDDAREVALPPCHTLWQCKVRTDPTGVTRGVLDLQLYQRSADCFLGVPFNIASYALLLHLLAHTHGFRPGVFVHTFGDLHIYHNHRAAVDEQLSRAPYEAPALELSPLLANAGFAGLMRFAEDDDGALINLSNYNFHPPIKADVAV